ncbi:MAG: hypothetical protein ACRDM1_13850 [Gaiellaceae bacterium]
MRRLIPHSKAPLGLAGFLALPIFFASLLAVTLAIEKARVVEWKRGDHLARVWHQPTNSTEAKIWLLALVPPLLLVLVGWIAAHFPYGLYVTCVAACVDALALTIRLHRWQVHHTARFAYGEDLIADQTTSSSLLRGEWEHDAAQTVRSLVHYTIGLSLAAVVIAVFLRVRRGRTAPVPAGSELQQTGGAPTTTGV